MLPYRRVGLVDKLDVIKNVSSYFITCLELLSLDAFALQQPQDALLYCIVMALIPSAHAGYGHKGTYASSAATVTAGLVAGATEKSAGTDWRSGWIRVPGRHSEAIGKSDRRQTLGADGCEKGLLRHDKAVYTFYKQNLFVPIFLHALRHAAFFLLLGATLVGESLPNHVLDIQLASFFCDSCLRDSGSVRWALSV